MDGLKSKNARLRTGREGTHNITSPLSFSYSTFSSRVSWGTGWADTEQWYECVRRKNGLVVGYGLYSHTNTVLVKVLWVSGWVERGLGDELFITGIISILSFSNSNKVIVRINWECYLVVSLVLQPVEELNDDGTSERPLEAVVVLTFHNDSSVHYITIFQTQAVQQPILQSTIHDQPTGL